MELDQLYDVVESTNSALPYENPVDNAVFGGAAAVGYATAVFAEGKSGREAGEYSGKENLMALGAGGSSAAVGGTVMDGLQEAGKELGAEYGVELGAEKSSAAAMGAALGAAAGGSSVEGVRRLLSRD